MIILSRNNEITSMIVIFQENLSQIYSQLLAHIHQKCTILSFINIFLLIVFKNQTLPSIFYVMIYQNYSNLLLYDKEREREHETQMYLMQQPWSAIQVLLWESDMQVSLFMRLRRLYWWSLSWWWETCYDEVWWKIMGK